MLITVSLSLLLLLHTMSASSGYNGPFYDISTMRIIDMISRGQRGPLGLDALELELELELESAASVKKAGESVG